MKKCSDECKPVCDFCKHYEKYLDENGPIGSFSGESYCEVKKEDVEFYEYCEEFQCFNVKG